MSQKIYSNLDIKGNATIGDIANATSDTDKFLVSDAGVVKYRTGSEMLSDLGVAPGVASNIQHQVKAGVAISKGQAVYVTGADGTNMIVGLASNSAESTSSKTMGLMASTVATNGFGNVIAEGLLAGLNTSTANAGDPVWLGTGGNLIYGLINKPYAPNHLVFIGIVTRSNANNGEIFVKVQNGFELNEIHDVDTKTTAPAGNDILAFEGAPVNLWKNKTIASVLGYTPYNASNPNGYISSYTETDPIYTASSWYSTVNNASNWNTAYGWGNHASAGYVPSARTITINGTSYDLSANRSWTITALETDTLATVTGRGSSTSTLSTFDGGLNIGNAKLRWGANSSPTLGFPFTGGPNAFWIDVNDGDTGGLAIDNDGTTIYGAGDSGHVFRVIDEDVYQATSNIDASTTFRIQQGQNGGGYIRGNFEITGTLTASGYNKTNWDTAYGWGNHASAGYLTSVTNISGNAGTATQIYQDNEPVSGTYRLLLGNASDANGYAYNFNSLYFNKATNTIQGANISGNAATATNADYANAAGTAGNADTIDNIDSSRIVYGTGSSKISSHSNANEWRNSGFYENEGGGSNWPSGTWYNSINVRHSNQGNYHGFQLAMSYYDNNLWFRSYQGSGTFQGWQRAAVARGEGTNYVDNARYVYNNGAYSGTGWVEPSDLGVRYANTSNYSNSSGSSGVAGHLATAYIGGQRLNPQDYFNNGVGLKAAMTAKVGVWSDTLWINGYSGGDVLWMCALHTQRNSSPRMYISAQLSTSTSYGTAYEFLTEYNYSDYAVTKSTDQDITGIKYFLTNNNAYSGSTSSAKLQAYSTGNNSAFFSFHKAGHYALNMGLDADNVLRIGGWSAAANRWQLDMSGNMTVAGDVTAYSDIRVKENIETIDKALDKVLSLRGVTYNRIDSEDKSKKIGVIAQEVQNILPQVVHEQADGMLGVSYGNITAVLIEAIKEQQTQIEELKKLVNQLTNR